MAFVSRAEVTGLYPSVFLAGPYAALSFNLKVMTSASNPKPPPFTKLSFYPPVLSATNSSAPRPQSLELKRPHAFLSLARARAHTHTHTRAGQLPVPSVETIPISSNEATLRGTNVASMPARPRASPFAYRSDMCVCVFARA